MKKTELVKNFGKGLVIGIILKVTGKAVLRIIK